MLNVECHTRMRAVTFGFLSAPPSVMKLIFMTHVQIVIDAEPLTPS